MLLATHLCSLMVVLISWATDLRLRWFKCFGPYYSCLCYRVVENHRRLCFEALLAQRGCHTLVLSFNDDFNYWANFFLMSPELDSYLDSIWCMFLSVVHISAWKLTNYAWNVRFCAQEWLKDKRKQDKAYREKKCKQKRHRRTYSATCRLGEASQVSQMNPKRIRQTSSRMKNWRITIYKVQSRLRSINISKWWWTKAWDLGKLGDDIGNLAIRKVKLAVYCSQPKAHERNQKYVPRSNRYIADWVGDARLTSPIEFCRPIWRKYLIWKLGNFRKFHEIPT